MCNKWKTQGAETLLLRNGSLCCLDKWQESQGLFEPWKLKSKWDEIGSEACPNLWCQILGGTVERWSETKGLVSWYRFPYW